ncbi:reverse transcriptase domain-containing protein [Tanacetum coccineum]|uniref:Reverse transcriptase domain-containing protein n=1 Tax=Tanacetum coccineum TaxID=301880 RepID=A0ABQ5ET74_9ASTR
MTKTPPPGFSTPHSIPIINTIERPPVTTTVFAATTLENTPFAYCASTLANPNPMISPAFIQGIYEVLESLLRERRRQIRNEDLRNELEYFSENYDEEREMEPRPGLTREITPPLRPRSPEVRRQRERVVGFEEAPNREGSRARRNAKGSRPSKIKAMENGNRGMNLPPTLGSSLGKKRKDTIVILAILSENFELKHGLLNLVTSKQFFGFDKEDPHAHIRWFNKITSTIKYKDVPNSSIKLMLFPFSIEGAARIWLEKEPPRSILTWEDLVSKFINQFFPPLKTTNLQNEITNFQQRFDESFYEAWERFKDLLRACPHHGFMELHQIDTFYNSLTSTDQDLLNATTSGNLLTKTPKDALTLIENKSKVCTLGNRPVVAKVSTNTSTLGLSPDVATLTDAVKALLLKNITPPPAFVKAVEESCVTCGGPHPYYQCLAIDGNASGYQDNIQAYVSAAAVNLIKDMLDTVLRV